MQQILSELWLGARLCWAPGTSGLCPRGICRGVVHRTLWSVKVILASVWRQPLWLTCLFLPPPAIRAGVLLPRWNGSLTRHSWVPGTTLGALSTQPTCHFPFFSAVEATENCDAHEASENRHSQGLDLLTKDGSLTSISESPHLVLSSWAACPPAHRGGTGNDLNGSGPAQA